MATSKQIRAYAQENGISNAEAKAHFITEAAANKEAEITNNINNKVIELLDEPLVGGFNKIFDDSRYAVYSPLLSGDEGYEEWSKVIYDEKKGNAVYDTHLGIYHTILGGVEAQSFNLYAAIENHYINVEEQQRGSRPFERNEGSYRMAFLFDKENDKIVPLFFNTWDMTEKQLFRNWRGDEMYLTGLYAGVCRTLLASIPLSGFNPKAEENLEALMRQSMMSSLSYRKQNWLNTYDVMYQFGLYLMEHPDHKDQALTFYRIKD